MKKILLSTAVALTLATPQITSALSVSGSVGGAPTGVNYLNFDDLVLGAGTQFTHTVGASLVSESIKLNITTDAAVVEGEVENVYAAPFISGLNANNFVMGAQTVPGDDETKFLTSGKTPNGGIIEMIFNSPQQYLGLLWGSVDSYNTLEFYNGAVLVDTVTGSDVTASPNGNQGVNGTLYVNINTTSPFTSVKIRSSEFAFELDNVAYNVAPVSTPDGGTLLGSLGLVLAGMAAVSRRRTA